MFNDIIMKKEERGNISNSASATFFFAAQLLTYQNSHRARSKIGPPNGYSPYLIFLCYY
jgi:hypothetical protein